MDKKHYFGFDVESIGVWGPAFAFGYVVVDEDGNELESGFEACPLKAALRPASCLPTIMLEEQTRDAVWVEQHVVPALGVNYATCRDCELSAKFIEVWQRALQQYSNLLMVVDCPFPVETNFLAQAIPVDRRHLQPYPLLDVASVIAGVDCDPLADLPRKENELPKHHPTNDARQSVRIFVEGAKEISRDRSLAIAHGYYGPIVPPGSGSISYKVVDADAGSAETIVTASGAVPERKSTITPEEVDEILKRALEEVKDLEPELRAVFRRPPYNIILD